MMFNNHNRKLAEDEIDKRRKQSRTYTEPLPLDNPEVESYLEEFYSKQIFERAQEFKKELETYSDTVGVHYEFLVPEQVSFDQFFSRYYYRCNIDKLVQEMQQDEPPSRKTIARSRSGDVIPLPMPAYVRTKSNDGLQLVASNFLAFAGGGGTNGMQSIPSRDDIHLRRASRRPSVSIRSSAPIAPKENTSMSNCREARNELALRLLEEARGKRLDDTAHSPVKPMSAGIQIKF
jgi:hypothetical protein